MVIAKVLELDDIDEGVNGNTKHEESESSDGLLSQR